MPFSQFLFPLPRIYISAAHKSSGKTTLSIGLSAALNKQGLDIQTFKKGPDYIDPLWLSHAAGGRSCHNLDFNTMSDEGILRSLASYGQDADMSLIEGNLGLYDGVALDGSDSNAALAKLTQTPVILVIDSQGITRGVAPLLLGYQQFDPDINIAGVIYNMSVGGRHEAKLRAVTKEYTDIPVLGVVKRNPLMELDERHLGLKPINEGQGAADKIDVIAKFIAESVDLTRIVDIANSAPALVYDENPASFDILKTDIDKQTDIRLGICQDSAFGFYYASDKLALKRAGAELIPINTLTDEGLPEDLDGLFIGGGFPETHMTDLEANNSMRKSIRRAIEAGLPTYAECGGLMYLSQSLHWNGQSAEMVGIIPAQAHMYKKPQGRGYVKLEETAAMPWDKINERDHKDVEASDEPIEKPLLINAHEFHYSRLESGLSNDNADLTSILQEKGRFAYQVHRGIGITGDKDGWVYKNLLANYAHMRDTDRFHWAQRFVEFIRRKKKEGSKHND